MRELKISKVYHHFKGNDYLVVGIAEYIDEFYSEHNIVEGVVLVDEFYTWHTEKDERQLIFRDTMNRYWHTDIEHIGEEMVVYKPLQREIGDKKCFIREINMFLSEVDKEKYPDVKQQYRFEEINIKSIK